MIRIFFRSSGFDRLKIRYLKKLIFSVMKKTTTLPHLIKETAVPLKSAHAREQKEEGLPMQERGERIPGAVCNTGVCVGWLFPW
jgi:hypothetical protein